MTRTRVGAIIVAVGVVLLAIAGVQLATTPTNAGLGGFAPLGTGMAGLAILVLGGIVWAVSSR